MAVTAVTPTVLAVNTVSADILDADGTVATTPTDGWSVDLAGHSGQRVLVKLLADASGDTVTFTAGDRPPSQRSGLGSLAVVLAASDVRYIVIEQSRFLHDDGTFKATCVDAGTSMRVFILPKVA